MNQEQNNRITRQGAGQYTTKYVDVCRICGGTGQIVTNEAEPDDTDLEQCHICEGSGRVVVTKEIKIIVKPFKSK